MARMPDMYVDITVTSPPYNLGKDKMTGKRRAKYENYNDCLDINEYLAKTDKWINELYRVTKYYVFYNIQEVTGNKGIISHIYKNHGDKIKEVFIWAKTNPASHVIDDMCASGYEYIFCFSRTAFTRRFRYCNFSNKNGDYMRNVIIKPTNSNNDVLEHSYAFGDWLPKFFIHNFSKEGDLVYDPFMGSGTTAKAAHLLKRNWIGSEISEKYVELAYKRLDPYLRQQTLF